MKNNEIISQINGNTTTTRVITPDGISGIGVAKCSPSDKFDANVGCYISTQRAKISVAKTRLKQAYKKLSELHKQVENQEKEIRQLVAEIKGRGENVQEYYK